MGTMSQNHRFKTKHSSGTELQSLSASAQATETERHQLCRPPAPKPRGKSEIPHGGSVEKAGMELPPAQQPWDTARKLPRTAQRSQRWVRPRAPAEVQF